MKAIGVDGTFPDPSHTDVEDYRAASADIERGGATSFHHPELVGRFALAYGPEWQSKMQARVAAADAMRERLARYEMLAQEAQIEPVEEVFEERVKEVVLEEPFEPVAA